MELRARFGPKRILTGEENRIRRIARKLTAQERLCLRRAKERK